MSEERLINSRRIQDIPNLSDAEYSVLDLFGPKDRELAQALALAWSKDLLKRTKDGHGSDAFVRKLEEAVTQTDEGRSPVVLAPIILLYAEMGKHHEDPWVANLMKIALTNLAHSLV